MEKLKLYLKNVIQHYNYKIYDLLYVLRKSGTTHYFMPHKQNIKVNAFLFLVILLLLLLVTSKSKVHEDMSNE